MANKIKRPLKSKKTEPAKPTVSKQRVHADPKEILRRAAIAVLALVLVCGVVLSVFSARGELLQRKASMEYAGVLQQECLFSIKSSDEEVRANVSATKRHGQTHAFSYFCSNKMRLNAADMTGFIRFGNPADNDCTLVLTVLDRNGNLIYRSGGVQPGKYISQMRSFVELEKGTHVLTAYVSGYSGQGYRYKCVGVQYTRLTVEVGDRA